MTQDEEKHFGTPYLHGKVVVFANSECWQYSQESSLSLELEKKSPCLFSWLSEWTNELFAVKTIAKGCLDNLLLAGISLGMLFLKSYTALCTLKYVWTSVLLWQVHFICDQATFGFWNMSVDNIGMDTKILLFKSITIMTSSLHIVRCKQYDSLFWNLNSESRYSLEL